MTLSLALGHLANAGQCIGRRASAAVELRREGPPCRRDLAARRDGLRRRTPARGLIACCSHGVGRRARAACAVMPCQLWLLSRSHLRRHRHSSARRDWRLRLLRNAQGLESSRLSSVAAVVFPLTVMWTLRSCSRSLSSCDFRMTLPPRERLVVDEPTACECCGSNRSNSVRLRRMRTVQRPISQAVPACVHPGCADRLLHDVESKPSRAPVRKASSRDGHRRAGAGKFAKGSPQPLGPTDRTGTSGSGQIMSARCSGSMRRTNYWSHQRTICEVCPAMAVA